jgi:hypothetical protein
VVFCEARLLVSWWFRMLFGLFGKLVSVLVTRNGVGFCRDWLQILLVLDVGADYETDKMRNLTFLWRALVL